MKPLDLMCATLVVVASLALEARTALALTLSSTDFAAGQAIPAKHTCEGEDVSPSLVWTEVPAGAKSLVVIVDDPDAPDPKAPERPWVHWVLFNIPPTFAGFPSGVSAAALPPGTHEGLNDWGRSGYGGPCPPIGRHRFVHKLYALDIELSDLVYPNKADVERAMEGHVLESVELIGTYEKAAPSEELVEPSDEAAEPDPSETAGGE